MRKKVEVEKAEQEFLAKIWYGRHCAIGRPKEGENVAGVALFKEVCMRKKKELESKYGIDNLVFTDFEWGMVSGKLSTLRWMLGDEWDMLDS